MTAVKNNYNQTDKKILSRKFWSAYINEDTQKSILEYSFIKENIQEKKIIAFEHLIDSELSMLLSKITNLNPHSIHAIVLSGFALLLHQYTNKSRVGIGTCSYNNKDQSYFFPTYFNTIPSKSYKSLLDDLKSFLSNANKYSIDIVDFQENEQWGDDDVTDFTDISVFSEVVHNMAEISKIIGTQSLSILILEETENLTLKIQYDSLKYEKAFIKNTINHFEQILKNVLANPNTLLSDINYLDENEIHILRDRFNQTEVKNKFHSIKDFFENSVQKNPNDTALVFPIDFLNVMNKYGINNPEQLGLTSIVYEKLSFGELNKKANKLANHLISNGVVKGDLIAVIQYPSFEMIISILAIIKSGAAFLPIDPELPKDRIQYILKDSKVRFLMAPKYFSDHFSNIIFIDTDKTLPQNISDQNLDIELHGSDRLYVIYTSGTTGKPKGVAISHDSLCNYAQWFLNFTSFSNKIKSILISSFSFDLGYTALFSPLMSGGELHLLTKDIYYSPSKTLEYIKENKICLMKTTPSYLTLLVNSSKLEIVKDNSLEYLFVGGESIIIKDIEEFHTAFPLTEIVNHYGPTEATIGCIVNKIDFNHIDEYKENPSIGLPLDNTKAYILDSNLNMQPIGIQGELMISGSGLALEYLNDQKLTNEKFIQNPFEPNKKLYKTGDRARRLFNGKIEFIGRFDSEVKISGFRVNTKEIENEIKKYDDIQNAFVLINKNQDNIKNLVLYYQLKTEKEMDSHILKDYLSNVLPEYMIPSIFFQLKDIPLTANGKVNFNAFPKQNEVVSKSKKSNDLESETEKKVATIWSLLLGIDINSLFKESSFFDIGGQSITAILFENKVFAEFGVQIPITELLKNPTIEGVSDIVTQSLDTENKTNEAIELII